MDATTKTDLLASIEQEIEECRKALDPLEAGKMVLRNNRQDTTAEEVERLQAAIRSLSSLMEQLSTQDP